MAHGMEWGVCMAGGHVWQGVMCGGGCMAGVCAWKGACVAGGHAWWGHVCMARGGGMRATADTIQQNIIFGVWSNF